MLHYTMSTIVCQNVVSCFDSQLAETMATLKLKVVAPPPEFGRKMGSVDVDRPQDANLDFGNWGFLQTAPKETSLQQEKDSFYTAKTSQSFSRLSAKSLELCTENLGSETGSDTVSDSYGSSNIFSSSPPFNPPSNPLSPSHFDSELEISKIKQKSQKNCYPEDLNSGRKTKNFPPPLSSMSGSSSLQVRRHRGGGRLIIEAVETPPRNSYMQAERSDGRLRLCFSMGPDVTAAAISGEEQEEEDGCGGEMAEEEFQVPGTEIESDEEEFDGEMNLEMGMEKFQWLSRCKEGGHGNEGLCSSNWKPALWVATS